MEVIIESDIKGKIAQLVIEAKDRNSFAEEQIYKLLVDKVYYLALKMMKNPDDTMDMVQDSFIKAFQKLNTLED